MGKNKPFIVGAHETFGPGCTEPPRPPGSKRYRLIDLFSGAGGMSLGFSEAFGHPFQVVWANDCNRFCVATYNENFGPHGRCGDIVEILAKGATRIPLADVVIGGPPCQGFSLLNRDRRNDPRKQLWRPFLDVVEQCGATIFVMENVPQLLGTSEHVELVRAAESLGFLVRQDILNVADYGVAQNRTRAIIIGCTFADPAVSFPPLKTHGNPKNNGHQAARHCDCGTQGTSLPTWKTVRDAVGDLPPPEGTEMRAVAPPCNLHFGRNPTELSRRRYRAIPGEGMNRFDLQRIAPELTPKCWLNKKSGGTDVFGRLWWDKPSVTIRTEFFKPEKGRYLHPEQHRPITHREAARFQSFPDSFTFVGSKMEIAKQIGNAVPPLFAARVADVVELLLEKRHQPSQDLLL